MQSKNDRLVHRVFLALVLSTGLCAHFTVDASASTDKKQATPASKGSAQSAPKKSAPKASAPKARPQSRPATKPSTPNRSRPASRPTPTTKTPTRTNTPPRLVFPTRLTTPTPRTVFPTITTTPKPRTPTPSALARKSELEAILSRLSTRTKPTPTPLPKPDPQTTILELPREIPPGGDGHGGGGQGGGGGDGHGGGGQGGDGNSGHHHHNDGWTQCCGDGFNFWFRFGSPFWGGFGWGFGYVNDCGWWWWARDGYCSPWWRSPWSSYCWWYPSPYSGWYPGWSTYTTVVVQQPVIVNQQQSLPGTSWVPATASLPTMAPPQGDAIVIERPDGSILIASPSQAWLYLGYGEVTLAAEIFAAMLHEEPNATEYLLGYTLALACSDSDQTKLAALALEEVLHMDAGVLLSVPLDPALRERLGELKLRLLLAGRGIDIDAGSVMLLAAVRTILGEENSALAALRVAEELFGVTPGSEALRRLLEQLREANLLSMR